MAFSTEQIRNVAIAGHGQTGKTTLFERILFAGGAIAKPETVESGKTTSDYTSEEIDRKISVHAALAHVDKDGKKLNFLDTPGSSDFSGDVILSFRAAQFAAVTVDAASGVQIETIKLWRNLDERGKPRAVFITKMDGERADFDAALKDVGDKLKAHPVPITIPMGKGAAFKGVIDVLNEKAYMAGGDGVEKEAAIPDEYKQAVADARAAVIEAAAEGDDSLMMKFLETESLEPAEIHTGLIESLAANAFIPAFAGCAAKNSGIVPFINFIADIAPSPKGSQDVAIKDEAEIDVPVDEGKPLSALVIRTSYDQFSGKLSWVKVVSGKLTADSDIFNVSENKKERVGKLYTAVGKKLEEIKELAAGDVGIISKLDSLKTNDTVTAGDGSFKFLPLRLPEPVHMIAVNATEKKNEDKLGAALVRAAEEDKTLRYSYNAETKESVLSGMGELQINIILDKIKTASKIEVETKTPRIAYRETITKKAGPVEYTHKKQTGGHGQYGKVVIEIAPRQRGEGYNFVNAIFGGSIPKNYIPGVEKGLVEGMARGVLAQYPVVDVEVKLIDGKYHPVDSNELSFRLAARNAFRDAMKQANPTLLEPIMNLTVFVEDKYLGNVSSDLSGKRGRILGQDSAGGIVEIRAEVPQAELLRYSIDLRSITSGTGSFNVEFDHYSPISGRIADDVIKAAEAYKVAESDE
ncbi:MAG: elongation factor G [Spirochaetaceae bacterium]|jgi:elongation factor G|nr:elongation factor G [Spirochaetaceae bacterium]